MPSTTPQASNPVENQQQLALLLQVTEELAKLDIKQELSKNPDFLIKSALVESLNVLFENDLSKDPKTLSEKFTNQVKGMKDGEKGVFLIGVLRRITNNDITYNRTNRAHQKSKKELTKFLYDYCSIDTGEVALATAQVPATVTEQVPAQAANNSVQVKQSLRLEYLGAELKNVSLMLNKDWQLLQHVTDQLQNIAHAGDQDNKANFNELCRFLVTADIDWEKVKTNEQQAPWLLSTNQQDEFEKLIKKIAEGSKGGYTVDSFRKLLVDRMASSYELTKLSEQISDYTARLQKLPLDSMIVAMGILTQVKGEVDSRKTALQDNDKQPRDLSIERLKQMLENVNAALTAKEKKTTSPVSPVVPVADANQQSLLTKIITTFLISNNNCNASLSYH